MSKVITFSRYYPHYHPKAKQPTYFAEKFWNGLINTHDLHSESTELIYDAGEKLGYMYADEVFYRINQVIPKHQTIRAGHTFSDGDLFKPAVWGDDINPTSEIRVGFLGERIYD